MTTKEEFEESLKAGLRHFTGKWEELAPTEGFWKDQQPWLESKGYLLRPRYRQGWTPSWLNTSKTHRDCEDGLVVVCGRYSTLLSAFY